MKQGGVEYKPDRILVFEPWAIGIYGVNLMLDGEPVPVGSLIGPRQTLGRICETVTIAPLVGGSLHGFAGLKTTYLLETAPEIGKPLRLRFVLTDGRAFEDVRPVPEIIWASDPARRDPFGRIPLIELKHFTAKTKGNGHEDQTQSI